MFKKLFFFCRVVVAVSGDLMFSLMVGLCGAFIYLTIPFGGLFMLIKYNTNGGVWDGSMLFVVMMIVLGCLGDVSNWNLCQRLLGVHSDGKQNEPSDNEKVG